MIDGCCCLDGLFIGVYNWLEKILQIAYGLEIYGLICGYCGLAQTYFQCACDFMTHVIYLVIEMKWQ